MIRTEAFTILLVEDNPAHATLVKRSLADHSIGNTIHHVSDGEAALAYLFEDNSELPHLILLDLRLPRVDGLSVLQQIKNSSLAHIPVVVLTTSDAEADARNAYHHRANSYLVKPLDYQKFSAMMTDVGYYWLQWNYQL